MYFENVNDNMGVRLKFKEVSCFGVSLRWGDSSVFSPVVCYYSGSEDVLKELCEALKELKEYESLLLKHPEGNLPNRNCVGGTALISKKESVFGFFVRKEGNKYNLLVKVYKK